MSVATLGSETAQDADWKVSPRQSKRQYGRIFLAVLAYAALRVLIIPLSADLTAAFSHDSAYIGIVARNLLAARGLVNDASWLVFLNPRALPMPFHNANPLYILATAGAALFTRGDVVRSGLVISALANAGLVLAVVMLLERFAASDKLALILAFAVALFPAVFADSLQMLPDALCLTLSVAFVAALVRDESRFSALWAGLFLGLAWLTRSSAIVLVPAACVYVMLTLSRRHALVRLLTVAVVAGVVVIPWLWYTARVWGSPFRSDASYYLVQDLVSEKRGYSVIQYWHSPEMPPPLLSIARAEPLTFVQWLIHGVRSVVLELGRTWSSSSWAVAILLGVIFAAAAGWCARVLRRPIWLASATYVAMIVGIFAVRARTVEVRYVSLVSVLAATVVAFTTLEALRRTSRDPRHIAKAVAAAGVAYWLVSVPVQDAYTLKRVYETSEEHSEERRRATQAGLIADGPLLVAEPYFQSWYARKQALSIPYSDDEFLLRYMRRFGARHVLLTDAELDFWRPAWKTSAGLPAGMHRIGRVADATLFELGANP